MVTVVMMVGLCELIHLLDDLVLNFHLSYLFLFSFIFIFAFIACLPSIYMSYLNLLYKNKPLRCIQFNPQFIHNETGLENSDCS